MMPVHLFHHPSRVLAACCVLALSACANEALNNQLASSREAVDQAKIAGAAERAPADYDVAVDKLNQASAAADNRKNKDAMRLAQEAEVDANLARARNDATQARLAVAELEKSNQILREEYLRAHPNEQR
jgi:hypothetical protein